MTDAGDRSDGVKRRALLLSAGLAAGVAGLPWSSGAGSAEVQPYAADGEPAEDDGDGGFAGVAGYRVATSLAAGGSGTPEDPWVLPDAAVDEPGLVVFDAGSFVTNGLRTAPDIDYDRWSVWLRGAGVRTTRLRKTPTDGHLLTFDAAESGNFGGASGMALYGHYPDDGRRSRGNLLHSTGSVIDLVFRDLIVRYGWGDGVHVESSSSGTRLHNSWIENCYGWAVYLGGGTRAKLSNLHIITCFDGAIYTANSNAQISNLSLYNVLPGLYMDCSGSQVSDVQVVGGDFDGAAIVESGAAASNRYTGIDVEDVTTGVVLRGEGSHLSNCAVRGTEEEAVRLLGDGTGADGLSIRDAGQAGTPAVELAGDGCQLSGATVHRSSGGSDVLARITGDRAVLANVTAPRGTTVQVDGATEAIVTNVRVDDVVDDGTRTLVNGRGTNDGHPEDAGEWYGHADYAHAMGATVWDTTTTPWTPYRADGAGNWIRDTSNFTVGRY